MRAPYGPRAALAKRNAKIVRRCLKGETYESVAASFDIRRQAVHQIFRAAHPDGKKPRLPKQCVPIPRRMCARKGCDAVFETRSVTQRYCSHRCAGIAKQRPGVREKQRRAYELRSRGLAWSDISDLLSAKAPVIACNWAKQHAVRTSAPWPIVLKGTPPRFSEQGGYVPAMGVQRERS